MYTFSKIRKEDDNMKNEIVLFENQDVKLEVNVKDETVWLSLEQMAKLFGRDRTVITRHINNIFKSQELDKMRYVQKLHIPLNTGQLKKKLKPVN